MTTDGSLEFDLGPLTQFPSGEGRAFALHGRQVAVFNLRGGCLRAVDAVCPHRGGPIADGQTDGAVVLCPLHLTPFDLATGQATGAELCLTTYPVHLGPDDHVIVSVPA